ncbi:hypothetical protein GC173_11500 [bacterium]|nr:hypothetical protein [bacterium]
MSDPFNIEQTDGDYLYVVLDGAASPEVDLPEEYALRFNTTYYPGNPEPTIQVLNHAPEPMRVQGLLSDRLMGTQTYAQQTRELLMRIFREAHPVVVKFRDYANDAMISRLKFNRSGRADEIRYDIEFTPIQTPESLRPTPVPDALYAAVVEARRIAMAQAYEDLPLPMRTLTEDSPVTIEDLPDPPPIAPIEFVINPWLKFQLEAAAVQAKLIALARMTGNEKLLNTTDKAVVLKEGALIAAGKARAIADELSGGGSVLGQLTDAKNIGAFTSSADTLRLAL